MEEKKKKYEKVVFIIKDSSDGQQFTIMTSRETGTEDPWRDDYFDD